MLAGELLDAAWRLQVEDVQAFGDDAAIPSSPTQLQGVYQIAQADAPDDSRTPNKRLQETGGRASEHLAGGVEAAGS